MNSRSEASTVNIVRWVARLMTIPLLGLMAALAVGQGVPNLFTAPPRELTTAAALIAISAGLAAGWRWEGHGGLLIVGGFGALAVVRHGLPWDALWNMLWAYLLVGLLFLYCRWKTPAGGVRRNPWFYRLTVPSIWLTAALFSWHNPGDEYGLFAVALLPAVWLAPFLHFVHLREVLPFILAAGTATMFVAGWLMDRLQIHRAVWFTFLVVGTIALVLWSIGEFPTYQRAMAKNGSLTAYVAAATNLSLYVATLLTVAGSPMCRLAARRCKRDLHPKDRS